MREIFFGGKTGFFSGFSIQNYTYFGRFGGEKEGELERKMGDQNPDFLKKIVWDRPKNFF